MIELKHALLLSPMLSLGCGLASLWANRAAVSAGASIEPFRSVVLPALLCATVGFLPQLIFAWAIAIRWEDSVARCVALSITGLIYGAVLLMCPAFRLRTTLLGFVGGAIGGGIVNGGYGFEVERIAIGLAILAGLPMLGLGRPDSHDFCYSPILSPRAFRRGLF